MQLYSCSVQTPIGPFHLVFREDNTVIASGFGALHELQTRLMPHERNVQLKAVKDHSYRARIEAYFEGDPSAFSTILYDIQGTPFQQAVWKQMAEIPYGETRSYSELALTANYPLAVRAVASACKNNRLLLLIPCHRVLPNSRKTGQYYYGENRKEYLLNLEKTHKT